MNLNELFAISNISNFATVLLGSFMISYLIIPKLSLMFYEAGFIKANYKKDNIPLGMGLAFLVSSLAVLVFVRMFKAIPADAHLFMFVISIIGLVGFIDDMLGTRKASGFAGHFKNMFSGELTTGALKAVIGGIIALFVSLEAMPDEINVQKWLMILLNTMIIALSTNSINLLDLRPGRAGKGYILAVVLLILIGGNKQQIIYLGAVTGSLIAYLNMDLRGQAMMGDTGANILGVTIGYVAAFTLPFNAKIWAVVFLILFHLFTEKYSLTKLIEKNRILNYLDEIGRR